MRSEAAVVPELGKGKVFAAMSGGVDSSVAALLLQRQGYEVVGVTFKLFDNEDIGRDADRACCSLDSIERARAVCNQLGITHYVMSMVSEFAEAVIDRFVCEYAAGRTPNPCVLCNRHIKFEAFLRKARAIGADFVATGHHARLQRLDSALRLLPARDPDKDQSYALAHLNQSTMPYVLFPVGEYLKTEVRDLAREAGLPTAETPESQDICFVPEGTYQEFLAGRNVPSAPGPIMDTEGHILGVHAGLHHYTVGQRKNLGISAAERLYVIDKRIGDNALVVGPEEQVRREMVQVEDLNWCDLPAGQWPQCPGDYSLQAMLRYRQKPIPCSIVWHNPDERTLELELDEPGIAAPGQTVALYDAHDAHVVAGGTIR